MLGTEVRLTPSTMMAPWSLVWTPISSRPRPVVWGTWPMVSSTWLPHPVRPGGLQRPQAPALEPLLDDHGGVLVLGREDAVTADDEGDLGAEAEEGGGV